FEGLEWDGGIVQKWAARYENGHRANGSLSHTAESAHNASSARRESGQCVPSRPPRPPASTLRTHFELFQRRIQPGRHLTAVPRERVLSAIARTPPHASPPA